MSSDHRTKWFNSLRIFARIVRTWWSMGSHFWHLSGISWIMSLSTAVDFWQKQLLLKVYLWSINAHKYNVYNGDKNEVINYVITLQGTKIYHMFILLTLLRTWSLAMKRTCSSLWMLTIQWLPSFVFLLTDIKFITDIFLFPPLCFWRSKE